MPTPSKVDQLPDDIRKMVTGLLQDGRTIREILAKLFELVEDGTLTPSQVPSKSSIGRKRMSLARMGETLRRSRDVAQALVADFGDKPESELTRLNLELMQTAVLDLLMAAEQAREETEATGDVHVPFAPKDIMMLGKGLSELAKAQKATTDVLLKARQEAVKKAAATGEQAAKQRGMTDEDAAFIRAKILGIPEMAAGAGETSA